MHLWKLAIKANDDGEYIPVWGTCLGLEFMMIAAGNDTKVLENLNSINHSEDIKFLKSSLVSKLYSRMPEKMKKYLAHSKSMYFNHKYGIEREKFMENEKLKNFFDILTLSTDRDGK